VDLYLSSGGADGYLYTITPANGATIQVPSLLLTTTGRKSGQKFIFPLFYGRSGDSYFVIALKGGAPEHPGWYRNILADPLVEVQVGGATKKARARTASGDERTRLWEQAVGFFPPYADINASQVGGEIPVVVLDPIE